MDSHMISAAIGAVFLVLCISFVGFLQTAPHQASVDVPASAGQAQTASAADPLR